MIVGLLSHRTAISVSVPLCLVTESKALVIVVCSEYLEISGIAVAPRTTCHHYSDLQHVVDHPHGCHYYGAISLLLVVSVRRMWELAYGRLHHRCFSSAAHAHRERLPKRCITHVWTGDLCRP